MKEEVGVCRQPFDFGNSLRVRLKSMNYHAASESHGRDIPDIGSSVDEDRACAFANNVTKHHQRSVTVAPDMPPPSVEVPA